MKIVVAIDSFKGSLTSMEAGRAAETGAKNAGENICVKVYPLADGGEGTCRTLTAGLGGEMKTVEVTGALGNKIRAEFGEIGDLAIIEMAAAAGLNLVPENLRNPLNTTTYGVGEMILSAARDGCRNFIVGIGGSATNDCGLGMLTALGFDFGAGIFGRDLAGVRKIDAGKVAAEIGDCSFKIACDVKNPLTGDNGCSAVYGPQKGATPEIIARMDGWIKNFGDLSILVNNAGIAGDMHKTAWEFTAQELIDVYTVDFIGVFELTKNLLPLLEKNHGRIVNITMPTNAMEYFHPLAYQAAKAPLNVLIDNFGFEFAQKNMSAQIFGIMPGVVSTDLNDHIQGAHVKTPAQSAREMINYIVSGENYNGKIIDAGNI